MTSQTAEQSRSETSIPIWKLVAGFYVIACGFSWLVWSPWILGPDGLKVLRTAVSFPVFVCVGTMGPLLACFVVHRWDAGDWRAVQLIPPRPIQWIWLILGPLLIVFARVFVFAALSTEGGPAAWRWHVDALAGLWIPMLNYNLFGGPLFEEFGWRGFLQSRLQHTLPPWIASLVTGVMWAAWHLPLFIVGWGGVSFPLFLLILVGVSLIMTFAFNASGQALVVVILMHSASGMLRMVLLPDALACMSTQESLSWTKTQETKRKMSMTLTREQISDRVEIEGGRALPCTSIHST